MKDYSEYKREFRQLSRVWYGEANLHSDKNLKDKITIGYYHPDGSTAGEFTIDWIKLGPNSTPLLRAFDDAWSVLWAFKDVLEKLTELDGTDPSPEEICELLKSCNIEDATETEDPINARHR